MLVSRCSAPAMLYGRTQAFGDVENARTNSWHARRKRGQASFVGYRRGMILHRSRSPLTTIQLGSDHPRMIVPCLKVRTRRCGTSPTLRNEPDAAERTRRCGTNPTLRNEPDAAERTRRCGTGVGWQRRRRRRSRPSRFWVVPLQAPGRAASIGRSVASRASRLSQIGPACAWGRPRWLTPQSVRRRRTHG
jgi:hypothetical protein